MCSSDLPDASALFQSVDGTIPSAPNDLLKGIRPPAPSMDMSVWPHTLSVRARQVAESVGCDVLVPLFAGLGAVCAVVDAQMRLELMPGFKVPPVLWLMTIGDPADKKSPGSRPMMQPLRAIEAEDIPRYKRDLLNWEAAEAAYNAKKIGRAHV